MKCCWCGKTPELLYVDLNVAKPKHSWYKDKKGIICHIHLSTSDLIEVSDTGAVQVVTDE